MRVTDAPALDAEFASRSVPLHRPLHHEYGQAALIVRDPDGNLILFASPT